METTKTAETTEIIPAEVLPTSEKIEINLSEIIKLKELIDDYTEFRKVILYNLSKINSVAQKVEEEINIEGVDAGLVNAWNSLIKSSNESLKILTESYKNISNVLMNVHKVNSLPKQQKENSEFKIENTADIIKRLREAK